MAKSFHISPRSRNIGECDAAPGGCPFGPIKHYPSQAAALKQFEKDNEPYLFPSFRPSEILVSPLPKTMRVGPDTLRVRKGVYVVGDPFFAVGQDQTTWELWKREIAMDRSAGEAVGACYNNFAVVGLRSDMGAGTYVDMHGREYPVESGYVGLTPMSLLRRMGISDDDITDSGSIVTFPGVTTLQKHPGGVVSFGDHLDVYTDKDIYDDPIDVDEFLAMLDDDDEHTDNSEVDEYEDDKLVGLDEELRRRNWT